MNKKYVFIIVGGSSKLGSYISRYLSEQYPGSTIIATYNSTKINEGCIEVKTYAVDFLKIDRVKEFICLINNVLEKKEEAKVQIIYTIGRYYKERVNEFCVDEFNSTMSLQCTNFMLLISNLIENKQLKQLNCIYISSNLTIRCNRGTYAYIASKKAAESIIMQLAYEYKKNNNYRFNIIAPGYFGGMDNKKAKIEDESVVGDICKTISLFIEGENITGSKIVIDGGETIGY